MATPVPVPRSEAQTLGDIIADFCAEFGIPTLRVGGPLLSVFEAAARSDVRAAQDAWQSLDLRDLDSAHGEDLDQAGADLDAPRFGVQASYGYVTVTDASFTRISTQVYQGKPSPIAGSTTVYVVDGSGLSPGDQVYLGRGTANYEGPIQILTVTNSTTFWTLGLATPTQRFHNQGESVTRARGGDRVIPAGGTPQTPRTATSPPIQFRVQSRAVLPDGEDTLSNVLVVAVEKGSNGNVAAGAIKEWLSPPFAGAAATNPSPFTPGRDTEEDDDYRARLRQVLIERMLGTRVAIQGAVLNRVARDEGRRITSASFVRRTGVPSLLVVDDGTGYEERSAGVAFEQLFEAAAGGEQDAQLRSAPVAKAFQASRGQAPFALVDGARLTVLVGVTTYAHTFHLSDFASPGAATAYEVAASINANASLGFGARTLDGGSRVVLYAREETLEAVEVLASDAPDANTVMAFPAGLAHTLFLYRNDRLLSKDGAVASYQTAPFVTWGPLTGPQTLTLSVDGTPAITFTFTDQDFVDARTAFNALASNSPAAWAAVFNFRIPGVTATTDGSVITLTSARGMDVRAGLAVAGGTLVTQRVFQTGSVQGSVQDYRLDRSTGEIRLAAALVAGDRLSAGTRAPRAFVESPDFGTLTLASPATVWAAADAAGAILAQGVNANTPVALSVTKVHDWGYRLLLEAFPGTTPTASVFASARPGDWAVLWDPAFPAAARGAWRIADVGTVTVGPSTFATRLYLERRAMRAPRAGHRAVALTPLGASLSRVLVCGGWLGPSPTAGSVVAPTETAELFDPATKAWTTTAAMASARAYHTATRLPDGRVLVVGGLDRTGTSLASVEIWSPGPGTWAAGPAYPVPVAYHRAVLLQDGRVLVCGGKSGTTYRTDSHVFDPGSNTWSANTAMGTARARHGLVVLPSGLVLTAGGETTGGGATATAEVFSPGPLTWSATGSMPSARKSFGLALAGTTKVVAVGDDRAGGAVTTYAVYTIATTTWGANVGWGGTFANKSAITLDNGNVLAAFGKNGTTPLSQIFNGTTWAAAAAPLYADAPDLEEHQAVLLFNQPAATLNQVLVCGGVDPARIVPVALAEMYDGTGDAWSRPDPAVQATFTLPLAGLALVRTARWLQALTVPAGANYTASSLAAVLSGSGLAAAPYRTSRLRLGTTTFAATGDVLLAAADSPAQVLGLTPSVIVNQVGAAGSVLSGTDDPTPTFRLMRVLEDVATTDPADRSAVRIDVTGISPGAQLTAARDHDDGIPASVNARWGRNAGFRSTFRSYVQEPEDTYGTLRDAPHGGWVPYDRLWAGAPYALGPQDDLTVLADADPTLKRFVIPMYRRARPVGATYGATGAYLDADNGLASLAAAFGLAFDWADFAAYMRARAQAFGADASRSMLFRYYLHGPAGERARVRVAYPDAPNAPVTVAVDDAATTVDVRAKLAGGAPRALPSVRGSARVGVAVTGATNGLGTLVYALGFHVASATRDGANLTTLTLDLPPGVTDCGLVAGNTLFLASSNPSWTSGTFAVTAVAGVVGTQQNVTFTNVALGVGVVGAQPNIGTVSFDPLGEATLVGTGVAVNDWFRVEATAGLAASFTGATFRVNAFGAQYIQVAAVEKTFGGPAAALAWAPLNDTTAFRVFQNPGQTATVFAAAVNALAAVDLSPVPVTVTVLGTGAGQLLSGTVEDLGSSTGWLTLTDGLNFVSQTVFPPDSTSNYQLTFKGPVTAGLATNSDWNNEDVRLVPVTPATVAAWLAAPGVSGLFQAADVAVAGGGRRVQIATLTLGSGGSIQVQSGLANAAQATVLGSAAAAGGEVSVQVSRADAAGLQAGAWVQVRNAQVAQKAGVFTAATVLSSWAADGTLTLSTPAFTQTNSNLAQRVHMERQGRFMVVSDVAGIDAGGALSLAGVQAGDWVRIAAAATPTSFRQIAAGNLGVFRVARVQILGDVAATGGAVWLENDLGVEETAECDLFTYTYDSVLPGDQLVISTPLWGAANQGAWAVQAVGGATPFLDATKIRVSAAARAVVPVTSPTPALGASAGYVQALEASPSTLYRRITTTCPSPGNGAFVDVHLDLADLSRLISASYGSVLVALDKLQFNTGVVLGVDAYQANTGLVREAGRITYGDPADPAGYPGVGAEGSSIVFAGPTVKRIRVSLQLRASTGFSRDDVTSKVQAAVAAEVNRTPVGKGKAISSLVAAASRVQGVEAVTVLSPAYTATSDLIDAAATEKLLVLDLRNDINISYVAG